MAQAGPGLSPLRREAIATTMTAQGMPNTATAEQRPLRKELEASTTRSVKGPSLSAGSSAVALSWRWSKAVSRPTPSARRKWDWWSSTTPEEAHQPRL
eukprot:10464948-Alexandrium_andersonii.AAC.1